MKDKFYVGQRVRAKTHGTESGVPKGTHGTVIAIEPEIPTHPYAVLFDGYRDLKVDDGAYACQARDLEPVYDGDQKISWSECVWQPKKETA